MLTDCAAVFSEDVDTFGPAISEAGLQNVIKNAQAAVRLPRSKRVLSVSTTKDITIGDHVGRTEFFGQNSGPTPT